MGRFLIWRRRGETRRIITFFSLSFAEEVLTAGAPFLGPTLSPVVADAFLLNQAIESLQTYSLVRREPEKKTLSVHRLVQAVLQALPEEAERCGWAERAMLAVNAVFPDVAQSL